MSCCTPLIDRPSFKTIGQSAEFKHDFASWVAAEGMVDSLVDQAAKRVPYARREMASEKGNPRAVPNRTDDFISRAQPFYSLGTLLAGLLICLTLLLLPVHNLILNEGVLTIIQSGLEHEPLAAEWRCLHRPAARCPSRLQGRQSQCRPAQAYSPEPDPRRCRRQSQSCTDTWPL
jgi:hypothetical protein